MLARKKIAVIGAGKLGETLIKALLEAKVVQPEQITATTRHPETGQRKGKTYGISTSTDNAAAAKHADIIIVSVKP
ncbi:MAG: NAD(P)-binding domain-containing protein, partial [Planctomycetes bacterium]|nr:NAD(P)-binding domain-containing protein [Planctomycetota bacterium]